MKSPVLEYCVSINEEFQLKCGSNISSLLHNGNSYSLAVVVLEVSR
jgi:hypothetical protein